MMNAAERLSLAILAQRRRMRSYIDNGRRCSDGKVCAGKQAATESDEL
jgi:hypothetical protein